MQPVVERCREMLAKGRARSKKLHDSGTPGAQVSNQLADLYDDVVLELWNDAIQDDLDNPRLGGLSLVAHGGFGRRDMAPYSDADVMLLAVRRSQALGEEIAGKLTRGLSDCGIDPGFSIRTPGEACSKSWDDSVIFSSLTESRLLSGSLHHYQRFFKRFRRGAIRRKHRLTKNLIEARRQEQAKWGETSYMLRPNVKRSRGGLRDIQLIRWLGFAHYGEADLDRLVGLGFLPEEDYRLVRSAYGFLIRLRHELHFRTEKSQDVLDRGSQLEIAEAWGYRGHEGVLPVEEFMQQYFENIRNVRYAIGYVNEDCQHRSPIKRFVEIASARRLNRDVMMSRRNIWVRKAVRDSFARSLPKVLELMVLAGQHDRRIDHPTWRAIRVAMQEQDFDENSDSCESSVDQESTAAFLKLLAEPTRLASSLRKLHELRILERLIPEFARMRGLLQFNAYHKYTVDAHSLLAVQTATELADAEETNGMARRYRRMDDKWLLHLALLIHDIGKGYEEDHCIVGERIAARVADRLGLSDEHADTLRWLVLKHLEVNVVA
ncbi:MAG: HD domain-containing protein, partial [Planctomycetota bacterium]